MRRSRSEFICRVRINLFEFLRHSEGWKFLSVIIPMSVLDTIVSLQVLESVQVAGDDYPTQSVAAGEWAGDARGRALRAARFPRRSISGTWRTRNWARAPAIRS